MADTFTFSKNGYFNEVGNSVVFERNVFTPDDIAMRYLVPKYGLTLEELTYEQLDIITRMVNGGWDILPSFFVEWDNEKAVRKIVPNVGCFMTWCDYKGKVTQYICSINYIENEIVLFNNKEKLAEFENIDALFECMRQIVESEPLKCTGYYDDFATKNLNKFNECGFDKDIFLKDNLVFCDMNVDRCIFLLDKNKCHELKIEKSE